MVIEPSIEARIEDVGDFSEGLARVDGQGFVDEAGRLNQRVAAIADRVTFVAAGLPLELKSPTA